MNNVETATYGESKLYLPENWYSITQLEEIIKSMRELEKTGNPEIQKDLDEMLAVL